jgi:rSAM/selenodomain-associated transferase 1
MTPERLPDAHAPVLLVFAREPIAGRVKTRLAAALGAEAAAGAYRDLIDATLAYAVAARTQGIVTSVEVWCTPDPAAPYFRELAAHHGMALHRQCEGDLGDRMSEAIDDALARAPAALLIGTDCPAFGVAGLAAATGALVDADVVLGPAEDGGFVLVGARIPVCFDGVRWSTKHALDDTRQAFAHAGLRWVELPLSWDVDEPADLVRWKAQIG